MLANDAYMEQWNVIKLAGYALFRSAQQMDLSKEDFPKAAVTLVDLVYDH